MTRRDLLKLALLLPAIPLVPLLCKTAQGQEGIAELERLAAAQFAAFGKAMNIAPEELQNPVVERKGTVLYAQTERWIYCMDVHGNQTLRPRNNLDHVAIDAQNPFFSDEKLDSLVDVVLDLAAQLNLDTGKLTQPTLKREVLLSGKCGETVEAYQGRKLIRLDGDDHYIQVLFDARLKPIRFDCNFLPPTAQSLSKQIAVEALSKPEAVTPSSENYVLGTFYAETSYRFQIDASSYAGEDFLDCRDKDNPFRPDYFDLKNPDFVNPTIYQNSQDYRIWCFIWWDLYGRVGASRGNWNPTTQLWDKLGVSVRPHQLQQYALVDGEPTATHDLLLSDGKMYRFPFAVSQMLEPRFYKDLEKCQIALFFTHAGTIDKRFHLQRSLDVWFTPGNSDSPFGSGKLRHLFIQGCGGMGYFDDDSDYRSLTSEWMPARYVKGLRTVCGLDGVSVGVDRNGWRFFGHYNKGDCILDSWVLENVDECQTNNAVVASYAVTQDEALKTLLTERFSTERAEPVWSVSSVWKAVPMLLTPPENAMWLDTLDVSKMTQGWGKSHARASISNNELRVGGRTYKQGIGTHAESKFAIDLKGVATRFTAAVGNDDEVGPRGSVTFEVWVDNQLVAQSPLMRKGKSFDFDIDLTGAKTLGLLVTDGGDGIDSDAADWCDALLYLDPKATVKPEAIDIK